MIKLNISARYHIPARKLDFVNVNLTKDNKLFIDPVKMKWGTSEIDKICFSKIENFVNLMIKLARNKEYGKLLTFFENFAERNETRLGYSLESRYGKSFGEDGGTYLVQLLSRDNIFESGFVEDIFDFIMLIPNIGEDKVSDFITAIIFSDLLDYTQFQSEMWNIPTKNFTLNKLCWNSESEIWETRSANLPFYDDKPIVFVPKSFVGEKYIFSHIKLYRDVIIPYYKDMQAQDRSSRFVVKYKNGRKHVLGNELRKEYPCTKYVILDFIKKYDYIYREYKNNLLNT